MTPQPGNFPTNATVDLLHSGGSERYSYAVIPNTPKNVVEQEIRGRLEAEGLEIRRMQVTYPDGPHEHVFDAKHLIGIAWAKANHQPQAEPHVAQGMPGADPAQTKAPPFMQPLPTGQQAAPANPAQALAKLLEEWAIRFNLSSTEFYLYLAQAQVRHATFLAGGAKRSS